jgi:hypothetical protein
MMKKERYLTRRKNTFEKKNGSLPSSARSLESQVDPPGRD